MDILNREKVLDRLLEAAARSPVTVSNATGEIRVVHELVGTGVRIRGVGPGGTSYDLIVPWPELDGGPSFYDPLQTGLSKVIRGLIHAGS